MVQFVCPQFKVVGVLFEPDEGAIYMGLGGHGPEPKTWNEEKLSNVSCLIIINRKERKKELFLCLHVVLYTGLEK